MTGSVIVSIDKQFSVSYNFVFVFNYYLYSVMKDFLSVFVLDKIVAIKSSLPLAKIN